MNPKYFAYKHLPPHLQVVSKLFHDLAEHLQSGIEVQDQSELELALRKLLESKDCTIRSLIK